MSRPLSILLAFAMLSACAAAAPQVKVLGVTDAPAQPPTEPRHTMLVFIEVVNPTSVDLQLSRLEYQFSAGAWLTVDGEVALSRAVGAGSTAVIEVPVQLGEIPEETAQSAGPGASDGAVSYSLAGRLFAVADRMERSWNVEVRGVLRPDALAGLSRSMRVRMRIADIQ